MNINHITILLIAFCIGCHGSLVTPPDSPYIIIEAAYVDDDTIAMKLTAVDATGAILMDPAMTGLVGIYMMDESTPIYEGADWLKSRMIYIAYGYSACMERRIRVVGIYEGVPIEGSLILKP